MHSNNYPQQIQIVLEGLRDNVNPNLTYYFDGMLDWSPEGISMLGTAAAQRNQSVFALLLSLDEIDVNKCYPLWTACEFRNKEVVLALLKRPDLDLVNVVKRRRGTIHSFTTALERAQELGHDNIANMVREEMERRGLDPESKGK